MDVEYRRHPVYTDYEIGTDGSVWSLKCGGRRRLRHCLVGQKRNYHAVIVCHNNQKHRAYVHRLVLEAWVGECPNGHECRHLDGNPGNNDLKNLSWGTPKENSDDRKLHGTEARGSRQGHSKLTESQVAEIRRLRAEGVSRIELGGMFGVCPSNISLITLGQRWTHVP